MQVLPLDEAHSNAYLGDLLSHSNRADDAEPYLVAALKLKPDLGMASTSLGMVKIKQRKFDEARVLLERAIAGDPKNHLAYYRYAYLLSREGRDEFGFVQKFEPSTAERMRDSLKKAIAINPSYTESYEMLAFVALVNNDQLEEAGKHLQTALKYQPGNQRYILRLAELLIRQLKFDEAKTLADKVEANAEDDETRSRAGSIRSEIQRHREFAKAQDAEKKRYEAAVAQSGGTARLVRRTDKTDPSPAEISRIEEAQRMRALNEALRVPDTGETRVLGRIEKIDCKKRPIVYSVKTATESFSVSSLDFAALTLVSLDSEAVNAEMGCDADLKAFTVLLTYKVATAPKSPIRGELIAVEFVPSNFRLMSEAEMQAAVPASYNIDEGATQVVGMPSSPPRPTTTASTQDFEARRREMIMQSIRAGLTKPGTGEKQELGFLDKIECNDKNFFFHIRTTSQTIKLRPVQNSQPRITVYTPDLTGVQFGCGTKPIEFPVVFTFADKPDKKSKTAGELIALEFVPKSFSLEP
jgi:Tfp pilus assembly protein PilF